MTDYRMTNRERSLEPRGKHFWCNYCDHDLVSAGGRCGHCRKKDRKQRFKAGKVTKK